jgi:transposase-like protein
VFLACIKIKGQWAHLYRSVDKEGQSVDFLLSTHRDMAVVKRFFRRAIEKQRIPEKVTLDGYAVSHEAVAELQKEGVLPANLPVRTSKDLSNVIEQDHRRVEQSVCPANT